jgi:pantothenate synthetase
VGAGRIEACSATHAAHAAGAAHAARPGLPTAHPSNTHCPLPRSRNARLTDAARQACLAIPAAIQWAQGAVKGAGGLRDPKAVSDEVAARIAAAGGKVDYVEVRGPGLRGVCSRACSWHRGLGAVTGRLGSHAPRAPRLPPRPQLRHAEHLGEVADLGAQPTLLAVAAHFPARDRGTVRLIDNAVLEV